MMTDQMKARVDAAWDAIAAANKTGDSQAIQIAVLRHELCLQEHRYIELLARVAGNPDVILTVERPN